HLRQVFDEGEARLVREGARRFGLPGPARLPRDPARGVGEPRGEGLEPRPPTRARTEIGARLEHDPLRPKRFGGSFERLDLGGRLTQARDPRGRHPQGEGHALTALGAELPQRLDGGKPPGLGPELQKIEAPRIPLDTPVQGRQTDSQTHARTPFPRLPPARKLVSSEHSPTARARAAAAYRARRASGAPAEPWAARSRAPPKSAGCAHGDSKWPAGAGVRTRRALRAGPSSARSETRAWR